MDGFMHCSVPQRPAVYQPDSDARTAAGSEYLFGGRFVCRCGYTIGLVAILKRARQSFVCGLWRAKLSRANAISFARSVGNLSATDGRVCPEGASERRRSGPRRILGLDRRL